MSFQTDTELRLFDEPLPIQLNTVTEKPATALLVGGIVNPFGPTLNVVMAHGTWEAGETLPVLRVMLNPFTQQVETVGEISVAETWVPSVVISQLFQLPFGSCPTLLLPSVFFDHDSAVRFHAKFLKTFSDSRRVFDDVKKHFGDPWERVSTEMQRSVESLRKSNDDRKKPLNDTEATELAALLLSTHHLAPELQAFMFAWKGSIDHVGGSLESLGFDEFMQMFPHLIALCRVPQQARA
jgi:hypothetical protein